MELTITETDWLRQPTTDDITEAKELLGDFGVDCSLINFKVTKSNKELQELCRKFINKRLNNAKGVDLEIPRGEDPLSVSERYENILDMHSQGYTTKEICLALNEAPQTLYNLFNKHGLKSNKRNDNPIIE